MLVDRIPCDAAKVSLAHKMAFSPMNICVVVT